MFPCIKVNGATVLPFFVMIARGSPLRKDIKCPPGESVTVYCKNYFHIDALGKPGINFNLKTGETIRLFSSDGTLLQSVDVPQLSSENNIYRMDPYSGIFYEEIFE